MKGFPNKSVTLVGSWVEIPDGPVFESNALACYGKTIYFHPPTINFGDHLKIVILGLMGFLSVAAVTRLKP